MKKLAIMPISLFGPIAWWVTALKYSSVFIDRTEKFEKQTFRNRFQIVGPNKSQWLTFPVTFNKDTRVERVELVYTQKWPLLHRRSLQAAYGKAPYYEHFSPFLDTFFADHEPLLIDKCLKSLNWVNKVLRLPVDFSDSVKRDSENFKRVDFEQSISYSKYYQVFETKLGFVSNASVLDLIFNLGPDATKYLLDQSIQFDLVASST